MGNSSFSVIKSYRSRSKAQSGVLGIVLLFAIVLLVSASVVIVGTSTLQEARSSTMDKSAETSMTELQSAVSELEDERGSRTVSFASSATGGGGVSGATTGSSVSADEEAGSISITVTDEDGPEVAMSRTLGTVAYESDSGELLYQGGGIFRVNDGGSSTVVSPPEFQYQNKSGSPTLRLSITNVTVDGTASQQSLGDEVTVRRTNHTRWEATETPIEQGDSIKITVESEAYRAWADLFRDRTSGTVSVGDFDGDGKMAARVTLEGAGEESTAPSPSPSPAPSPSPSPTSPPEEEDDDSVLGSEDLAATGTLVTTDVETVTYSNHAFADSYNSSEQPVSPSPGGGTNAPVYINGSYDSNNHVYIDGDLIVRDRANIFGKDNAGQAHHIEGDTIIGGDSTDARPTKVTGHPEFRGVFSTEDDLDVVGKNKNAKALFEGDVYVGGDVTSFSQATVEGDLYVQGDVTLGKGAKVQGDVIAGGTITKSDSGGNGNNGGRSADTVEGTETENGDPPEPLEPDLPSLSSIDDEIDTMESRLRSSNDNPGDGTIDDIEAWGGCDPSCTLSGSSETSEYYIEDGITLSSQERLVFDTTSGPITLYTGPGSNNKGVYLNSGRIEVHGDNPVRIFNGGNMELTGNGAEVATYDASGSTKTYRAPDFRVFMESDNSASFNSGNPEFTGVVHGPGGTDITLANGVEIYGAIIGEATNIPNHVEMHFDEALLSAPEEDEEDDEEDEEDGEEDEGDEEDGDEEDGDDDCDEEDGDEEDGDEEDGGDCDGGDGGDDDDSDADDGDDDDGDVTYFTVTTREVVVDDDD